MGLLLCMLRWLVDCWFCLPVLVRFCVVLFWGFGCLVVLILFALIVGVIWVRF